MPIVDPAEIAPVVLEPGLNVEVVEPGDTSDFSPADISGLVAWFDAQRITGKVEDDAISQWDDRHTTAEHLVQGTGTKQPLYKAADFNGFPCVEFDGTDDVLENLSFSPTTMSNLTIFMSHALLSNADGVFEGLISFRNTGDDFAEGALVNEKDAAGGTYGTEWMQGQLPLGGPSQTDVKTSVHEFGIEIISVWRWRPSPSSAILRVNGSDEGSVSSNNSSAIQTKELRVGSGFWSGSEQSHRNCRIGEIAIYNTEVAESDIELMETYLKGKWGVSF